MRYVGFWKAAEGANPSRGSEYGGHRRVLRVADNLAVGTDSVR